LTDRAETEDARATNHDYWTGLTKLSAKELFGWLGLAINKFHHWKGIDGCRIFAGNARGSEVIFDSTSTELTGDNYHVLV